MRFACGGVVWLLRVVVVLQCVGVAGKYLFSSSETESDVYGLMYFDRDWPEEVAQRIDDGGSWACLIGAGLALFCPVIARVFKSKAVSGESTGRLRQVCRIGESLGLMTVALWMLLLAWTHSVRGEPFAEWALGEHAVRYLCPIVIFVWSGWQVESEESWRRSIGVGLLVIASAATFAVHGYKALQWYGPFVDLILLTDARWTHFGLEQATTERGLWVIGVIDIVVASLLILTRWRWVALYMAVWGFIVTLSRTTAFGLDGWSETLIRSANGGVPLALWINLCLNGPVTATDHSQEIHRGCLTD